MASYILYSPVFCNNLLLKGQLTIFFQLEIIILEITAVIHHNGIEHTRGAKLNKSIATCDYPALSR